jgi:hypothetical protein
MSNDLLIPFRKKDKWGFYSAADKKIVIPCKYLNASVFSNISVLNEEVAIVEDNGLKGKVQFYINKKGENAIKLKRKHLWVTAFSNHNALHFAKVAVKKFSGIKIGMIDEQGRYIAKPEFEDCGMLANGERDREKILPLNRNQKWGVMSSYGELIIPYIFDHIHNYSEEGFAVCIFGLSNNLETARRYNKKLIQIPEAACFGFIDKKGYIVNNKFFYKAAKSFVEGFAAVQKPIDKISDTVGKWGFINPAFEEISAFAYEDARSFSNGMAAVCNNKEHGKWGFIDTNGNLLIDHKFENAFSFSRAKTAATINLAAVQLNDKWGFIDKTGNEIIECKYEKAYGFYNGTAAVCINNKWGFINEQGILVVPHKYDSIVDKQNNTNIFNDNVNTRLDKDFSFSDGRLIKVSLNNKMGFIDTSGNEYWEN